MDGVKAVEVLSAYINSVNHDFSAWCCGITADPKDRLQEHSVTSEPHYVAPCDNSEAARMAEATLLNLGCKGGAGGGSDDSSFVYIYLISLLTNP